MVDVGEPVEAQTPLLEPLPVVPYLLQEPLPHPSSSEPWFLRVVAVPSVYGPELEHYDYLLHVVQVDDCEYEHVGEPDL